MSQASYQPVDPLVLITQEVHSSKQPSDNFLAQALEEELVLSVCLFDKPEKEILPYPVKVSKAAIKGGVPVANTPKGATTPWFLYRPGHRSADC